MTLLNFYPHIENALQGLVSHDMCEAKLSDGVSGLLA